MRVYLRPVLSGLAAVLFVLVGMFAVDWDDRSMEPLPPVSTPLIGVVGGLPAHTVEPPARH